MCKFLVWLIKQQANTGGSGTRVAGRAASTAAVAAYRPTPAVWPAAAQLAVLSTPVCTLNTDSRAKQPRLGTPVLTIRDIRGAVEGYLDRPIGAPVRS